LKLKLARWNTMVAKRNIENDILASWPTASSASRRRGRNQLEQPHAIRRNGQSRSSECTAPGALEDNKSAPGADRTRFHLP